jgi:hypothetical protein
MRFVIGGPMLGQFELGVVARVIMPELSVMTGGRPIHQQQSH